MKLKLSLSQLITFFAIMLFSQYGNAQDEDVLFQAFDWNVQNQPAGQTWYDVVTQNKNAIEQAGIDLIWMPPPSDAGSDQGYLPRELYNLNSSYGTEIQLKNLINEYHSSGIKVIGDIVINHRVGTADAVTFTNPAWPTTFITADDEGRNFVNYPVEFSINSDYFPGNALKSDGSNGTYGPARDLDHKNPAVRQEIKNWMNFLKNDIGFDGWRYDFVHGYDPIYNKEYNDATNPYFAVGELLESSRVQTNNWVNFTQQSSSAFDFNTKVTLQNAIRDNNFSYLRDGQGNPSGMIGINPSKSVTFLDNHDTGAAQECCGSNYVFPGGETNLRKGYAYILSHPGNPMVFWTHFFDTGAGVQNAVKELIAARKSVRIYAGSPINIVEARNDLYAAYIDGRNGTIAMKLGSGNWSPNGAGWTLKASGTDYAVWTQGDTIILPPVQAEPFTVNFKKPSSWSNNVNVYFYDASTNNIVSGTAQWPGQATTNISGTEWYSYRLTPPADIAAENIRLIFNDGNNQTDDLTRSTDGWYNDSWSNTCLSGCPMTLPPTDIRFTVNFKKPSNWNANINVYLYDVSTNTIIPGTSQWPGQTTTNLSGTPWYSYDINISDTILASNIRLIFNDGTNQTDDLSRSTNGWFDNGTWSSTCPSNCSSSNTGTDNNVMFNFLGDSNWGSTTNVYIFNKITNTALSGTNSWPGEMMNNQTTSWSNFSFILPNNVNSNDVGVVFNNGNGQQTVDLTRGTSGWFQVTGESNGKATGSWSANCTVSCAASKGTKNIESTTITSKNKLYPNPIINDANLHVTIKDAGILQISVSNMLGQSTVVFEQEKEVGSHTIKLDSANFKQSGIYFCTMKLNGLLISKPIKLIKK